MRCLKRRLSDIIYRRMIDDAIAKSVTGPGGHWETSTDSSVTGSHSHTGSSDQSLPGPANTQGRRGGPRPLPDPGSCRIGRLLLPTD
jgi:hypothetical protein